ncbi:MAG: PEP-CTERM sorting domain-containing protein, partial [Phycisphaerales bacterium JB039]
VTGIIVGQLNFPPGMIFADPSNPIDVWKADFTVTDFTARTIDMKTTTTQFAVYPSRDSSISETRSPVSEGAASIEVVPAPASLALLGLGGLAAARRRR